MILILAMRSTFLKESLLFFERKLEIKCLIFSQMTYEQSDIIIIIKQGREFFKS